MTVLWTEDDKASNAKEAKESRTDAETESTEFASEAESSAEWVTSMWLDVKPAADKNDAKFLGWMLMDSNIFKIFKFIRRTEDISIRMHQRTIQYLLRDFFPFFP